MSTINNVPGATNILSELAIRNNPGAVVVDSSRVRGGSRYVDTLADRNNIPYEARVLRIMRCYVQETDKTYELRGGITDADWYEVLDYIPQELPTDILRQGGNAFGVPLVLRTTDGQPVRLGVDDKINLELSTYLTQVTGNFRVTAGSISGTQTQMTLVKESDNSYVSITHEGISIYNLDEDTNSFTFDIGLPNKSFYFNVHDDNGTYVSGFEPQGTFLSDQGIYIGTGNLGSDSIFSVGARGLNVPGAIRGSKPFPLMSTADRNAINGPTKSLFIYNETLNLVQYHNGTVWRTQVDSESVQTITGDKTFASANSTTISQVGTGAFPLKVRSDNAYTYMGIYNNGGPSFGASIGLSGNNLEFWNIQAGSVKFYVGPTAGGAVERVRIETTGQMLLAGSSLAVTDPNAMLELRSSSRGLMLPRLTTTQRDAMVLPGEGLFIFSTTNKRIEFHNGTAWRAVSDIAA